MNPEIFHTYTPHLVFFRWMHVFAVSHDTAYSMCSVLRAKAATALAHLSHRNSVRLSVHLSHGQISQKHCKLGSPNLHHWLPGRLFRNRKAFP